MGAQEFYTCAFGKSAGEAFEKARKQAEQEYGHQEGHSGHINMKHSVEVIPESEHKGKQKRKFAEMLIREGDERIANKTGPAGAINISGTQRAKRHRERNNLKGVHGDVWLLFGWSRC